MIPVARRTEQPSRVNAAVTTLLYTPPTISPAFPRAWLASASCCVSRILASVVPLAVAAVFARGDLFADARPCVAVADISVQLTSLPWQSELHVAFTNDPARATVRVQITDSAEAADFAVIDDIDNARRRRLPDRPAATGFDLGEPVGFRARDLS